MKEKQLRMTPAAIVAALAGDTSNALIAMAPGGIEAQEAAGQRSFVESTTLPKDCPRKELEALGVVFGADADDLFVNATLPAGWKKQATDHSMWSNLLDEQGRKRGGIFYKAAFYDRRADMHLNRFLSIAREYQNASGNKTTGRPEQVAIRVEDATGAILYDAGSVAYADYQANDQADAACRAWLEGHYPDWQSPLAYW